jgi:hypothetical protein
MNELYYTVVDEYESGVDRGNEILVIPVNGKCLNQKGVRVRGEGAPHDHVT